MLFHAFTDTMRLFFPTIFNPSVKPLTTRTGDIGTSLFPLLTATTSKPTTSQGKSGGRLFKIQGCSIHISIYFQGYTVFLKTQTFHL